LDIHERLVHYFSRQRRQGVKGKPDASRLPKYAREWEQLNPGHPDDAQNSDVSIWDRHFAASRSSNVEQVFYSTVTDQMRVIFLARDNQPRSEYVYFNVPIQVFNRLEYVERSGGSVGEEFWRLVRIKPLAHRYAYRRLAGHDEAGEGMSRQKEGAHAHHGMPGIDDTPEYAAHTRRQMERQDARGKKRSEAELDREFRQFIQKGGRRAEPKSARKAAGGGSSARAKKRR